MPTRELVVVVHGIPAPQGSKRHVGRGVLVESSKLVKPWRAAVAAAAIDVIKREEWRPARASSVTFHCVFTLTRPSSHYRTGRHAEELKASAPRNPSGRPDLDKLIRSTLDALTDSGALVDDARVIHLYAVKTYPSGHVDALDSPGAVITLHENVE